MISIKQTTSLYPCLSKHGCYVIRNLRNTGAGGTIIKCKACGTWLNQVHWAAAGALCGVPELALVPAQSILLHVLALTLAGVGTEGVLVTVTLPLLFQAVTLTFCVLSDLHHGTGLAAQGGAHQAGGEQHWYLPHPVADGHTAVGGGVAPSSTQVRHYMLWSHLRKTPIPRQIQFYHFWYWFAVACCSDSTSYVLTGALLGSEVIGHGEHDGVAQVQDLLLHLNFALVQPST